MVNEQSCLDIKSRLDKGEPLSIIDVREPEELAIAKLDVATHIPLGDLPDKLDTLEKGKAYAILCRSGVRSARATLFMTEQGFTNVVNIEGGIMQWAQDVDTSLRPE